MTKTEKAAPPAVHDAAAAAPADAAALSEPQAGPSLDQIQRELQEMRAELEASRAGRAAPPPTPEEEDDGGPDASLDGTIAVELRLQPRHALWLEAAAGFEGMSVSKYLEGLVRAAYAADPTKGGRFRVGQPEVGQGAVSHPRPR